MRESLNNIAAQEILNYIDEYISPSKKKNVTVILPPIISIPAFSSRRLAARIVNKLSHIPLRIARKSTTPYWHAQKQQTYLMQREIELLRFQVAEMQRELRRTEREGKNK